MVLLNLMPVCLDGNKWNLGDSEQDTNNPVYKSSNIFFIKNNNKNEFT